MIRLIKGVARIGAVCCLLIMAGCAPASRVPLPGGKSPAVVDNTAGIIGQRPTVKTSAGREYLQPAEPINPAAKSTAGENNSAALPSPAVKSRPASLEDVLSQSGSSRGNEQVSPKMIEAADQGFITQRLALYKKKMTDWNQLAGGFVTLDLGRAWPVGWYGCVQRLEMVYAGYRRFQKGNFSSDLGFSRLRSSPLPAYRRDIEYLESGCDQIMAAGQSTISKTVSGFKGSSAKQAAGLVRQYLDQGLNQKAASAYENFVHLYGDKAVSRDLKLLYSTVLRRQGRLIAALVPLADIQTPEKTEEQGAEVADDPDIEYADLLFANGRTAEAKKIYERIVNELDISKERGSWAKNQLRILDEDTESPLLPTYIQVLRDYYRFDGRTIPADFSSSLTRINSQAAGSSMVDMVQIIQTKVDDKAAKWTDQRLAKIDELIGGQEFTQAKAVVDELLTTVSEDRRPEVLSARNRILHAEITARQARRQLKKQQEDRQWRQAEDLFERREYKAAIGAFGELLDSAYAGDARKKMAEAANIEAVEMRRRAAGLFLKARKAADPIIKKQFLIRSRDLLQQAIKEYPQAGIIEKIKQNLQVLDEQIGALPDSLDTGGAKE